MAYGQVFAILFFIITGFAGMLEQGNPGHL